MIEVCIALIMLACFGAGVAIINSGFCEWPPSRENDQ